MKNVVCLVLLSVLTSGICWSAGAPVAVRVEVKPTQATADGTRVDVVLQISPEDRGRMGTNAMVRIEVDGAVPPGQSPLWAVRIGDDGSTTIETVWPAGEHDLVVSIESPDRLHTGLWVGQVRIPGPAGELASAETSSASESPEPEVPEVETVDQEIAAVAAAATVEEPSPEAVDLSLPEEEERVSERAEQVVADEAPESVETAEPPPATVAAVVALAEPGDTETSVMSEPDVEITSPDTEEDREDSAENSRETAAAAAVAAGAVAVAVDSPQPEEPPDSPVREAIDPPAAPEDDPVIPPDEEVAETVAVGVVAAKSAVDEDLPAPEVAAEVAPEDAVEVAAEPIVEPLRTPDQDAVVEPLRSDGRLAEVAEASPEAIVEAVTLSSEIASAYRNWLQAEDGTVDLTVVATRDREPVDGLQTDSFSLRLDKAEVAITGLGDRNQAPLNLGVAVDLSPSAAGVWGQASRELRPLVRRAGDGRGQIFVATEGESTGWGVDPDRLAESLAAPNGGDLGGLIVSTLGRFEGLRGRSFLIILTDGRTEPSKEGWKAASTAVAEAGVPLFVIALWDDGFSNKIRKQLSQIADASGGRMFLAQGPDQFGAAIERFGPLLDAGVALRFALPDSGQPQSVSVTSRDPGIQITAPNKLR